MLVSVIISVYKNINLFKYTLYTVATQRNVDFEVIIIDDGNDIHDKVFIRQECHKYKNVKIIENTHNKGLTLCLIQGIECSSGKFISRIDNGDLMIPYNRLFIQSEFLSSNSDHAICSGQFRLLDFVNGYEFKSKDCLDINGISHITVLMRRDLYFECGGYNPSCYTGQDSELWPRLTKLGKFYIFSTCFAIAPMFNSSISVKSNKKQVLNKIIRLKSYPNNFKKILLITKLYLRLPLYYILSDKTILLIKHFLNYQFIRKLKLKHKNDYLSYYRIKYGYKI